MAAIKATTDLSSIISKATEKASKAESSKFDDEILGSQLKAAEERIKSAENQVQKYDTEKAGIQDQLSPPPTKEVSGQGKKGTGSKTVVDEREKNRLEASLRASDVQLTQAGSAVEAARSEAEDLRGQALNNAGVSQDQQKSMTNLLEQIAQLQTEAKDDQTDLTGEDFQNKLNKAVADADKLAGDLPDIGDQVLQDFWSNIAGGFQDINNSITKQITPKPPEVKDSNNYEGFFQDISQGYNSIINHLEANGENRAVLGQVRYARDSVLNESNTYLGGMTSDDDLILQDHLTDINTIIGKINNGEAITNDDIAALSTGAEETSSILSQGGSAFEDVLSIPFNTIVINMNELSEKIDDPAFDEFFGKLANLYQHPDNNIADLAGISLDEVNSMYDYSDFVTDLKNQDSISSSDLGQLISQGNDFIKNLEDKHGFSTADASANSGNGGSGATGNSRVGAGSNRRY